MIKKIFRLSSLLFILMILSCQSNEVDDLSTNYKKVQLSTEELLSIEYKYSPELSQNEVFNLVSAFQATELKSNDKTRTYQKATSYQVKDKYYLCEDSIIGKTSKLRNIEDINNQIPIYEIEFTLERGKGLAVISGDRRAPYILAYIDKIKDNDTTLSTAPNALLQWSKMYILKEVEVFNANRDSLYTSAISKISKELNKNPNDIKYEDIKNNVTTTNNISRSTPVSEIPSSLKVKNAIYPMCPVTWNQWEPYNSDLPKANCERFGPGWTEYTNYPTGSGPIAVAHLMACVEAPLSSSRQDVINWEYLTENKEVKAPDYFNAGDPIEKRKLVAKIFERIYSLTKSYTVTNSNGIVTGSTCSISDIENCFNYLFDYDKKGAWNITLVKNSLKQMRPVFVYGKPDNKVTDGVTPFIIDGIKECYGRINDVPKDIDVSYLHANFGFGGGYQDGYYLMDIKTTSITFETTIPLIFKDNAMTIIPNIRRKTGRRPRP